MLMHGSQIFNLQDDSVLESIQKGWAIASEGFLSKLENKTTKYPEEDMTLRQLVERLGFSFEEHQVTTQDGYILTMHRVRQPNLRKGAPAVLCQHGVLSQSDTWIDNEPDVAIPF